MDQRTSTASSVFSYRRVERDTYLRLLYLKELLVPMCCRRGCGCWHIPRVRTLRSSIHDATQFMLWGHYRYHFIIIITDDRWRRPIIIVYIVCHVVHLWHVYMHVAHLCHQFVYCRHTNFQIPVKPLFVSLKTKHKKMSRFTRSTWRELHPERVGFL